MHAGEVVNGRFRIVREMGRGAFGVVFEAERLGSPGGAVAVKVLDSPAGDVADFRARFLREVRNAQRIEHPHVASVYELGSLPDGRLFYAMELCPGPSLQAMLEARERLEPARAVRLVSQVLGALHALHAVDMVHRDVKPANVVVVAGTSGDESAKLLDFGFAKVASGTASQDLTRDGSVFGSLAYMAPELILGHAPDARADLYAAGAVLFALLAGKPPFLDANLTKLATAIVRQPIADLFALTGGRVSPALAAVLVRALAKGKADRFATAERMLEALSAALP